MAALDSTVITKLSNGNVLVVTESGSISMPPEAFCTPELDGVKVKSKDGKGTVRDFKAAIVEKVIRQDGTEIAIDNAATLFTELSTNFFFKSVVSGKFEETLGTDKDTFNLPFILTDKSLVFVGGSLTDIGFTGIGSQTLVFDQDILQGQVVTVKE